nr:MAG TPA_asm: hypothetical protein [Caudoviricetes sp.]
MKRAYAVYSRKSRGCFLFMYTAHKTAMSQTMAIINIRISIPPRPPLCTAGLFTWHHTPDKR